MKAKKWSLVLLCLCNAVLIAFLGFLLTPEQEQTQSEETAPVYEVVEISVADVLAVKVENTEGSFAILQAPTGVEMIAAQEASYDTSEMQAFLYASCHMTGSRKVTDESTFAQYGIDDPQSTVTVMMSDDSSITYQILSKNPIDQSSYVYDVQNNYIYQIAGEIADLFLRDVTAFISHTIFPLSSRDDYEGIESITFTAGTTGRDYQVVQTDQGYYLDEPYRMRLSSAIVNGNLIDVLMVLYADDILAIDADLSVYGFDEPLMTVSMVMNDETYQAVFAQDEQGNYMMANPQTQTVYQIDSDNVTMLMLDYTNLLGGSVVSYAVGDVADITLTMGEESVFLVLQGTGTELVVTSGNQSIDESLQAELVTALNQIDPVGEWTAPDSVLETQSVLTLRVTFQNGVVETVAFYDVGDDLYAVAVDGEAHFVCDKETVDTLTAVVDALAQSMEQ